MKEKETEHEHYLREHKDVEDISRLSEKLTPPEESAAGKTDQGTSSDDGVGLVLDTGRLKLPKGFEEDDEEKRGVFGLEPVIIVIMALMIVFIALIAYLVYRMPAR